jgi:hypothetical protein
MRQNVALPREGRQADAPVDQKKRRAIRRAFLPAGKPAVVAGYCDWATM